jgi:hypothetical protein
MPRLINPGRNCVPPGQRALGFAERTIGAAFQVAVAIIIAGVLFTIAEGGYAVARNIASNLASNSA